MNEAQVPANAAGLQLIGAYGAATAQLLEIGETTETEIPVVIDPETDQVLLAGSLTEGGRYQFQSTRSCDVSGGHEVWATTFTAGPTAPLPTTLGVLYGSGMMWGEVSVPEDGQCDMPAWAVYDELTLELSEDAAPWRDLLVFETLVDGLPYAPLGSSNPGGYGASGTAEPGGSWLGRGRDRIYALCDALPDTARSEGVEEGHHVVQMRATLPGTSIELVSDPLPLDLYCAPHPPYPCDGYGGGPGYGCPGDCAFGWDPATGECATQPACPAEYDPNYESECPYELYYGIGDDEPGGVATGCSVGGRQPSSAAGILSLLGLLALVWRRRR